MKFIHLSDLHLGKRLNDYSLIEDQEYALCRILEIIDAEEPNGVLIAGDVYDKSIPTAEAIRLFDVFLTNLSDRNIPVFVISGNHDSAERMAFGSRLMDQSGVHIAGAYNGETTPIVLSDGEGEVRIYMLPFFKPQLARRFHGDDIESYTDAMRLATRAMEIDTSVRNILIAHQLVTGSSRCESEEILVGGTEDVDISVFDDFDYVALGHLHRPQKCTTDRIRYCGSPLKYSFSEAGDVKSVTVVEMPRKGSISVRTIPIPALRDMVELRGKYEELMQKSFYEDTTYRDDYVRITLTDEDDVPDAIGRLRVIYRNLMRLDYDNKRTRSSGVVDIPVEKRSPLELFSDFYNAQNDKPMTEEQKTFVKGLIEDIWEGEI
jgi:exonuclease SbcD